MLSATIPPIRPTSPSLLPRPMSHPAVSRRAFDVCSQGGTLSRAAGSRGPPAEAWIELICKHRYFDPDRGKYTTFAVFGFKNRLPELKLRCRLVGPSRNVTAWASGIRRAGRDRSGLAENRSGDDHGPARGTIWAESGPTDRDMAWTGRWPSSISRGSPRLRESISRPPPCRGPPGISRTSVRDPDYGFGPSFARESMN